MSNHQLHLEQTRLYNLTNIYNHYKWLKAQPDNYLKGLGIKDEKELASEISRLKMSVAKKLKTKHLNGCL